MLYLNYAKLVKQIKKKKEILWNKKAIPYRMNPMHRP